MENLTDVLVSQLLNSLDQQPVNPTKEHLFLGFMICKNLSDLCETGRAIVNKIESQGHSIKQLPDRSQIGLCQEILHKFYSDDMFIPDDDIGNRPNWSAVTNFDKNKSHTAYKIYRAIRKNIIEKPTGKQILSAINQKDKTFFINNFDKIFADIPFKDGLLKFRNFLAMSCISQHDQDYVWDFFSALTDIFVYEENHLDDLKSM